MPGPRPIYIGNILEESTAFTFGTCTVSVILWVLFFLLVWAAKRKKAQPLRVFGISFYLPVGFISLYCMWVSTAIIVAFLEQKYGITSSYKTVDFSYTVYEHYNEATRAVELYSLPIPLILPWPSFSTRDTHIISPLENFLPSPTLAYGCDIAILLLVITLLIITAAVMRMVSLHRTHQKWVDYADAHHAFIQNQSQAMSSNASWPVANTAIHTHANRQRRRSTASRSPSPSLKTPLLNPLAPPPAPPSPSYVDTESSLTAHVLPLSAPRSSLSGSLSRSSSTNSLAMLGTPLAPHNSAHTRTRKHSRTHTPVTVRSSTPSSGPRGAHVQPSPSPSPSARPVLAGTALEPARATVTTTTLSGTHSPTVSVTVVTTHGPPHGRSGVAPNARALASSRAAQAPHMRGRSRSATPSTSRQPSPTLPQLPLGSSAPTLTLTRSSSSRSAPSSREPSPATRAQVASACVVDGNVSINVPLTTPRPSRPPPRPRYTQTHTWLWFTPIVGVITLVLLGVAPLLTLPHDYLLVYLSHAHASTAQPSTPPTAFILGLVLVFVSCAVLMYAAMGVSDPFLTIAAGKRVAVVCACITCVFPMLHVLYMLCRAGAEAALNEFMSATSEIFVVTSSCYLLVASFATLLFVVLIPLYLSFKPRVWCVWPAPAQLASPEACLADMVALHWLTAFLDTAPPSAALPPSSIIQLWMALEVYRDTVRRLTGTVCSRVLLSQDIQPHDEGDEEVCSDTERVEYHHVPPQSVRPQTCVQCGKVPRACVGAVNRLAAGVYHAHIASQRRLFISPACRAGVIAAIDEGTASLHTFDHLRLELKSLISIAHGGFLASPYLEHCRRAMDVQCGLRLLMVDAGMLGPAD